MGAPKAEKRIDPEDGAAYTFDELCAYYAGKYKKKAIAEYWEGCKPAGGKKGKDKKDKDKKDKTNKDKDKKDKDKKEKDKKNKDKKGGKGGGKGEQPKAKANAKAKAKANAKAGKQDAMTPHGRRKPVVNEELLKAVIDDVLAQKVKTVTLVQPFETGTPSPDKFKMVESTAPESWDAEGAMLIQALTFSADPYLIVQCKTKKAGDTMEGYVCGRVLASKIDGWYPGDFIGASLPFSTLQVVTKTMITEKKTYPWRLTGMLNEKT